jgi:hypothetical protein
VAAILGRLWLASAGRSGLRLTTTPSGELRRDPWRDIKPAPLVPNRLKLFNKSAAQSAASSGKSSENHQQEPCPNLNLAVS